MPRNSDGSITISTIADKIERGYALSVYCGGQKPDGLWCHHSARIDLQALADKLGRDHSTLAHELMPYFRCSKCGSKDVSFGVHPPAPEAPTSIASPVCGQIQRADERSYRDQKRPRRKQKGPAA